MRVVMGGEALQGPLTGIGQYTFNLASQLLTLSEIDRLDFLVHGRIKGRSFLTGRAHLQLHLTRQALAKF